jgi:hypothetical protein
MLMLSFLQLQSSRAASPPVRPLSTLEHEALMYTTIEEDEYEFAEEEEDLEEVFGIFEEEDPEGGLDDEPSAYLGGRERDVSPAPSVDTRPIWMQLEEAGYGADNNGYDSRRNGGGGGGAAGKSRKSSRSNVASTSSSAASRGGNSAASAPEGMAAYEDHVVGILSACPNRTLNEIHDLLKMLDLPPT